MKMSVLVKKTISLSLHHRKLKLWNSYLIPKKLPLSTTTLFAIVQSLLY